MNIILSHEDKRQIQNHNSRTHTHKNFAISEMKELFNVQQLERGLASVQ